jgi:hypothetical protein
VGFRPLEEFDTYDFNCIASKSKGQGKVDFGPSREAAQNPCYTGDVAKNLTLTIDGNLLREARKIALDRNTSVNALVRHYLAELVEEKNKQTELERKRKASAEALKEFLRTSRVNLGPITWTRDELHERR